MPTMRTISKGDWKPTPLVSPDGRLYTPGSFLEDRELRTKGYVPAPVDNGEPLPAGGTPIDPATAAPDSGAPDPAAAAPKTKTTRRSNGDAK